MPPTPPPPQIFYHISNDNSRVPVAGLLRLLVATRVRDVDRCVVFVKSVVTGVSGRGFCVVSCLYNKGKEKGLNQHVIKLKKKKN